MHRWIILTVFLVCHSTLGQSPATNDWPMLAHDALRSGSTSAELRPPFERKWYRLFPEEGLMTGVQPVVYSGRVYIGTLRGKLHAIDAESGQDAWDFQSEGAILQSAGCDQDKVVFGSADGAIYALWAKDGSTAWKVQTSSAIWNAPAIDTGVVYIGSRDRDLYAIELSSGRVLWRGSTGGPLLGSPAVDPRRGTVYIGSEDMRVYAFRSQDGRLEWRSEKLPGVSLRGYHPVIAPDGSVLITVAPGISVDTFQALLLQMVKEVFRDFASWRHTKEVNAILREENFALLQKPETFEAEMAFLKKHLREEPTYQTFFILDPQSGKQKVVTPIVYSESMNGPGAPAIVSSDGQVIVKFQALLRSRYEHYSPFLNVGKLNTQTGAITPLLDESRTYGWFDSLLLVHDEQSQLSLAGSTLLNTHQDNVNGLDLRTREGFLEPFCRNIHEPKAGESLAIWTQLWRQQTLPAGKEWLARGTAVYGGGSVLDVPVSAAGNSFYYLPTHELNAGAAVIAYRMKAGGLAGKETEARSSPLNEAEWQKVQDLPWDWDTLELRRLDHVLNALPGKVPGTRQLPLTNEALVAASQLKDTSLDDIIWRQRILTPGLNPTVYCRGLHCDLQRAVRELISQRWRPLVFPSGKFPEEAYRFFTDPAETLYTLALAHPHLDPGVQDEVRRFVHDRLLNDAFFNRRNGRGEYASEEGMIRSAYLSPPGKLIKIQDDIIRSEIARVYPLWCWVSVSGDWSLIESHWPSLRRVIDQRPNPMEEDCRNGYIAGLIAYCRLADHMKDDAARTEGVTAARAALKDRIYFEFAHPRGGLIFQVAKMRTIFSRWRFMTPELGRFLKEQAGPIHGALMERYVEYHRPVWWLTWNVETMMRNECPYEFPTMSLEVFSARSLILGHGPEQLAPFIDLPWCYADEFYIQKLALTIDAAHAASWVDVRQAK